MTRKSIITFVLISLIASAAMAWDIDKPKKYIFSDSNDVAILDVDTENFCSQTLWIDTTYVPDTWGYTLGWMDQILVRHGIAALDTSTDDSQDSTGDDFTGAIAGDSGHVGISVQSSLDKLYWTTIYRDTTFRAAASFRSTFTHLIDLEDLMASDTLIGPHFRIMWEVFRDIDSTGNRYPITDTVWLDQCEIWGFGFD